MRFTILMMAVSMLFTLGCKNKGDGGLTTKEDLGTPNVSDDIKEDMRKIEHVVVFGLDWGGQAVPLACWDDKQREFRRESDCLNITPTGELDLALASGRKTTMSDERMVVCEPSGEEVPGLETTIAEGGDPDFGTWPADEMRGVKLHARSPRTLKPIPASTEEVAKLKKTIARVDPKAKGQPKVIQKLELDVDGDGKKDQLFSVLIENKDDIEEMYAFAGLILYSAAKPEVGQVLSGSKWELPVVMGSMDLDGDKAAELVIYSSYYEGEGMTVERFSGGQLETVGGWGCGA